MEHTDVANDWKAELNAAYDNITVVEEMLEFEKKLRILLKYEDNETRALRYDAAKKELKCYDAIISKRGSVTEMTGVSPFFKICTIFEESPNLSDDDEFASYLSAIKGLETYVKLKNWSE